MTEEQLKHGAIRINGIRRFLHRLCFRKNFKNIGRGIPDWTKGYDVRNTIGDITIKNQGDNFSCGGQAGSYFVEIKRRLQGIKEGAISAKSIYGPVAYPGGGTTITSLETQICAHGATLEVTVPSYDLYGQPLSEMNMTELSWETPSTEADALLRSGYTPYNIPVDIDTAASYIESYGAILMEITGQNGNPPGWVSPMPSPPDKGNLNELWNHFMCCIGYTTYQRKKCLIALQSKGTSWGLSGIQYISEDYFASGYIDDLFVPVYDTHLVPNSNNYSIWASVLQWFRLQSWFPKMSAFS